MSRLIALLCLFAALPAAAAGDADQLRVNGTRLNDTMQHLHAFGENAEGGSDRVAYSNHNHVALSYLFPLMLEAGLMPRVDAAGNLIGRRGGRVTGLAPIVTGSHIDTVPNGGHYDGIVGVMAAIEVARTLHGAGIELDHPLAVVVWSNEEGGKTGSRAWAGSVETSEFDLPSLGERNIGDGIRYIGGDPARLAEVEKRPGDIAGYVELHVEQGAVLEQENVPIGVVEGIVGIRRWNVEVAGFANHAGTTPMDHRQDALHAAALIIADIRKIITAEPGRQVATVGRLEVKPGAPNVIPGEVTFSLEIRDLDMARIGMLFERVASSAVAIAKENATGVVFDLYYESPAALTDDGIKALIASSASALKLESLAMPSGAGHDAQSLQDIAPIGMIFVPSRNGVSHAPGEFTSAEQITDGANVLLKTILGMDSLLQ